MFHRLVATRPGIAPVVLRLALGAVFFAHGSQKMLGWFGGHGFSGTYRAFTQGMHIPGVFVVLAIFAEFFGSLGLFTGLLTRVAAFGIACVMVVAASLSHLQGFFMNWSGHQGGEGVEYYVLAIGICLALMIGGAGSASIDLWLTGRAGGSDAARSPAAQAR